MLRGDLIKLYRTRQNMTQQDLALIAKTSPQNIYKYEIGEITNIPIWRLELIAQALDVAPSVLAGWEPDDSEIESSPSEEWVQIYTKVSNMPFAEQVAFGREVLLRLDSYLPKYLTDEEFALVKAWRRTLDQTKLLAVATLLGFPYEEDKGNEGAMGAG